jgi:ATP-binding cassette subfamily B protein
MIRGLTSLFTIATDLAQTKDPRLPRGVWLGALEAVLGAVPYVALYGVLSMLLEQSLSTERLGVLLVMMFGALAAQIALGVASMVSIMTASYALFGAARLRVADHIRRLPMGWFSAQRSGALLGVLTGELNMLSEIWSHFIAYLSGGLAIPLVVGGFLLFVDVRLGLVMMAALPLAFVLLALAVRLLSRITARLLGVFEDTNQAIVEYARGISVLRAFGRFGEGFQRLERQFATQRRESLRAEVLPAPLMGSYGFTVEAGFSVLVLSGASLLVRGALEADVFLLFVVVSMKFYGPLYDLGVSFLLLRFGKQALERTRGVITTPPLPEPAAPAPQPTTSELTLENVSFRYEESAREALSQVSVEFPARSLSAIVGPSGSGKSTLMHLLARLWDVSGGRVLLGGVDVRALGSEALHRRVSMVFQDVVLFSGSVRENIRLGRPDATDADVEAAARRAQAHDFIVALPQAYDTELIDAGATLSGGERQRLSIARTLLKDADVVLLDEATASVDPTAEAAIQRAIDELVKGKTVVVIAHRLRTVRRASRIVVLNDGRLEDVGTHDELVARGGLYARLWRLQSLGTALGHRAEVAS